MRLPMMTAMVAACLVGPAAAMEKPVEDITGAWVGKGFVQKDQQSNPVNVSCAVDGLQEGDRIGFDGECRAMLIIKREIGADLIRAGQSYTGTYKGATAGIAALAGTETGPGLLDLEITFPREVNGDRLARMMITRPGDGTFTIKTVDEMVSGDLVTTSQVTFTRK